VYGEHDWEQVRRLHHEDGLTKGAIAARLSMSRTTVIRLLAQSEPPRYSRKGAGSQVRNFAAEIGAILAADPTMPATAIAQKLRRCGYAGSLTILREYLRQVRPQVIGAQPAPDTTCRLGELVQVIGWRTGVYLDDERHKPAGVLAMVAGLPASAAVRAVFTLSRTVDDFSVALVGCLGRLGGVPAHIVFDHSPAVMSCGPTMLTQLVEDAAPLFRALSLTPTVSRPVFRDGQSFIEHAIGYLQAKLVPELGRVGDLAELQARADRWLVEVGDTRQPHRLAGSVARALNVERSCLRPLPHP
jgi:transposase